MRVALADESESAAQARQSVELRQRTRNDQVAVLVHQWSDIVGVAGDETGVGLINQHHRVLRDIFHDTANLLTGQTITRRIVRRSQQEHPRMDAVGVRYHLVDIVGEGVILLVQGIHLEGAIALTGHLIIVPPRELRDEDLLVVALHQIVMNGILQDILTAVGQQHLFLRHAVNLTQPYTDHTLLALIVDAGIEAQCLRVEVLDGFHHLVTRLEIKLVSIKEIHCLFQIIYVIWVQRY